jgi:hypothetical protein
MSKLSDFVIGIGFTGKEMKYRGAWDSGTTYYANDVVISSSISYVCIATTTNNIPPNITYWTLVGGGGASESAVTKSGDYTILDNDGYTIILISGTTQITLPNADTVRILKLVKTDAGTVATILRGGSDTIEGQTSITLNSQYDTVTLESDGASVWYAI